MHFCIFILLVHAFARLLHGGGGALWQREMCPKKVVHFSSEDPRVLKDRFIDTSY